MKTASGELGVSGETESANRESLAVEPLVAAHSARPGRARGVDFHVRRAKTHHPQGREKRAEAGAGCPFERMVAAERPDAFCLAQSRGFCRPAWLEPPHVQFHQLEWTEPPRWLQLPVGELGAVFSEFMETNHFASIKFELKPPPQFTVPVVPLEPQLAESSTLRIEGDIVRRPLLTPMKLPSWPYARCHRAQQGAGAGERGG